MRILDNAWKRGELREETVVTIGNFDGLHRGQRAILERLDERARGRPKVMVTFEPHPLAVLRPGRAPARLTTVEQKEELIRGAGIDVLAIVRFTVEFSQTTARRFVEDLLFDRLRAREVVVGSRFTFGREREGNLGLLHELGAELGFEVDGVEELERGGARVSSTRIRQTIVDGRVAEAGDLLGRPYAVRGRVRSGAGAGRRLGFPTLNIELESEILPGDGVYATRTLLRNDGRIVDSVSNVGKRPTLHDDAVSSLECHLMGFEEDAYGCPVEVEFHERLRSEQKFTNIGELSTQIGRDVVAAREYFAALGCS